jgi:hypothetical protein
MRVRAVRSATIAWVIALDLRSIPGTYTHPDGPPQPIVLTRE